MKGSFMKRVTILSLAIILLLVGSGCGNGSNKKDLEECILETMKSDQNVFRSHICIQCMKSRGYLFNTYNENCIPSESHSTDLACYVTSKADIDKAKQQFDAKKRTELKKIKNEGIVDSETGLIWLPAPDVNIAGPKEAFRYVMKLTAGGHNDWRLPTEDEIDSLSESENIDNMNIDIWNENVWCFATRSSIVEYLFMERDPAKKLSVKVLAVRSQDPTLAQKQKEERDKYAERNNLN